MVHWSVWCRNAKTASTVGPGMPVPDKYAFQARLTNKRTNEQTDKQMDIAIA